MIGSVAENPFRVDFRVAEDPLASLRFEMDAQAADLLAAVEEIEEEITAVRHNYGQRRDQLRESEARRRRLLKTATSPSDVAEVCARSLHLCAEVAAMEQALDQGRRRVDQLSEQYRFLRGISTQLGNVDGGDFESLQARLQLSQAERRLYQMVPDDFRVITEELLEVPMQTLANVVFEVELIGRRLQSVAEEDAAGTGNEEERAAVLNLEVKRCKDAASLALQQMHQTLDRISPLVLVDEGVVPALRHWLRARTDVGLHTVGADRRLPTHVELAIFRIVQEAVTNALQHGKAPRVDVIISFATDNLRIVVRDEGEGFDAVARLARLGRSSGTGLLLMQQQAEANGGSLEIRSAVGEGTEVRAIF